MSQRPTTSEPIDRVHARDRESHASEWPTAVIDGRTRSAAWWIAAMSVRRAEHPTPPIGSFGPGSHEGNSTRDVSLVAGFSNWLTVDAQREKAAFPHYGNHFDPMRAAVRAQFGHAVAAIYAEWLPHALAALERRA